jgi:hypothetical protein
MYRELLSSVARTLDELGFPYMVIGGQALLLHGEPRLTRDIDITLGATPDELDRLITAFPPLDLEALPEDCFAFARRTMVLPARHRPSGIRVDFIFSFTPYEVQAIARAEPHELAGYPVRFATAEDLVIHKVFAGRPRDLEDAESVLAKRPDLDRGYVERWLSEFDSSLSGRGLLECFLRLGA